jgi:hypothetical protein
LHSHCTPAAWPEIAKEANDARALQRWAPLLLECWPRPAEDIGPLARLPKPLRAARGRLPHQVYGAFGKWWCHRCSASSGELSKLSAAKCNGLGEFGERCRASEAVGHSLIHFLVEPGPRRLAACTRCSRYACAVFKTLAKPCTNDRSPHHRWTLRRLAKGWHPTEQRTVVLLGPAAALSDALGK